MAIKTVIIIGGSGFVGTHLALRLRDQYKVFATYHSRPYSLAGVSYIPLILESKNWMKRLMYTTRPDIIIYALGSNNIQHCEKYPKISENLHAMGPASLTSIHEISSPRFIFLSNSYVFDGVKGNYTEAEPTLPQTHLGKIKVSGENMVRSKFTHSLIIRSSPLYGRGTPWNNSFFDHLRRALARGEKFEASSQEMHSFAPVSGLCDLIERAMEYEIKGKVLHYGGLTKLTTFQFAQEFAKRFQFDPNLILSKKTLTRRPGTQEDTICDFSLNSSQVIQMLKIKPFLLEEGFDLIEKDLISHL